MGAVLVFIWLLKQQCGGRPQQICSSIKHVGAWPAQRCSAHECVSVGVCAPIGAFCHNDMCPSEQRDHAIARPFPLHACSSSESDRYQTVSHYCPGASKLTHSETRDTHSNTELS